MADKTLICQGCGNVITVSEFVSAPTLTCLKCKAQVPVPPPTPETMPQQPKLRIAAPTVPDSAVEPTTATGGESAIKARHSGPNDVRKYLPKLKKRKWSRKTTTFEAKVLPWLVFIVLASILAWARYWPEALPKDLLTMLISGGVWLLLFLHISIVCYAFTDDAFYGVLSLIIPGYSIYYLYVQSDQMLIRSLAGALILAFGWDALIAAQDLWAEVYRTVTIWIATTDTIKK